MKIKFIISIAALGLLMSCGEKEKPVENTIPNVPVIKSGLKIAFYVQDSLKTGFDYYREQDSITREKQLKFQKELESKQRSLQEYVAKNEKLMQSGQLSAFDLQTAQQEAQRREQSLIQFQQSQGTKIENETVEILEVLSKRIEAAGKDYCKKHGIDILLIHGVGGQINYIQPEMDVTKEFIAYLNQHQEEIEATVKGESAKKKKK